MQAGGGGAAPACPVRLAQLHAVPLPPQVAGGLGLLAAGFRWRHQRIEQLRQGLPQLQQPLQKQFQLQIAVVVVPDHPAEGAVLAPAVVVAPLAAAHLIAHQQHRHAAGQQQGAQQVALLAAPQRQHLRVGRWTFHAVVPAVVVVFAIAVVLAVGQVVFAVVGHQIRQGEAVVGGDQVHRESQGHRFVVVQIRTALEPLGQRPGAVLITLPEAAQAIAEVPIPGSDALGREVLQPVQAAAIPGLAHQLEIAELRIGFDRPKQWWLIQWFELVAAAEGDAQIEAEAIHPELQRPAAHRLQDQLRADRLVGGDGVAAAAHIQIVATAGLVVISAIGKTAPAQGWPQPGALRGVVVDHIQQHFDVGVMAGGYQLTHLMAQLQRIIATAVAVVGGEPAQRAVAPHVVATWRRIGGVEAEHRQQFDRRDAELLEIGQLVDQPQVGAPLLRGDAGIVSAGEAAHMQLINHRALPAVAGPWMALKIKGLPLGHHRLEAGMGVRGWPGGQHPVVDVPAADGAGGGVDQHLRRLKAVAPGCQRPEHPVAVAAALANAFQLHMPVIAGAVAAGIQFDHPLGCRR